MATAWARLAGDSFGLPPRGIMTLEAPGRRAAAMADDDADPAALIARIATARDKTAFATLFRQFAPRLKAFLARTGSAPDLAEEIAQETMIAVWWKADSFDRQRAAASTWIFTIARNKRIDLARRAGRARIDPDEYVLMTTEPPDAADRQALDNETGHRVQQVMADLPEDHVTLIRKAFFEDKSHSAIAAELRLPLGTVKSRIRLALRRLRAALDGDA